MQKIFGTFTFMFEVLGMVRKNSVLLKPIMINLMIAVPLSLVLGIVQGISTSGALNYLIMVIGITALYFSDYFANGLTASLIYQQVTTGEAKMDQAMAQTKKALPGIITFAAISALFDLIANAADRRSIWGKILTQIVYYVWTTAVYCVMPTMVLEGLSFGQAFKRSKELMKEDPTQVGAGVLGVGLMSWVVNALFFAGAYYGGGVLGGIHPIVGSVFFFFMINGAWAITGYIKISYFTCFYMWATECEKRGGADISYAPAPLAKALG
jgi:hypothetical protein